MRTRYPVAVHLFFFEGERVLLLRRFNTGWQDGKYSVPAGHVEAGETVLQAAVREAYEEVGLALDPQALAFVHVMQRKSDEERIDFFLRVKHWTGEISNQEAHKCDDLRWFSLARLPDNLIPYVRYGLDAYRQGVVFSQFGWE